MVAVARPDTTLDLRVAGAGEDVVLVHGSAGDRRAWDDVLPALARRRRVVAVSLRHHWPNPPAPPGYCPDPDQDVEDLLAVVNQVGGDPGGRVHLVGHSRGGLVVLRAAIRAPERLASLCLVEPPAFALLVGEPPRPARLVRLLATRPAAALAVVRFVLDGPVPARRAAAKGDLEQAVRRFGRAVLGAEWFARMSPERLAMAVANSTEAEFLEPRLGSLREADLRDLAIPTLLVGGAESPAVFGHLLTALQSSLPTVRRVTIADTSHLVPEAAPDALVAVLTSFLDELG